MDNQKIQVKTRFGTLVAGISADPSYPAIWVSLMPMDDFYDIPLVTVESVDDYSRKENLRTIVWSHEGHEEPTHIVTHYLLTDEERKRIYED